MTRRIKKCSLYITATGLLVFTILVGILVNPSLLYANKTEIGNYIIYHTSEIHPELNNRLTAIEKLLKDSEVFDPQLKIKICLNDGAFYPELIARLRGPAFAWGFYDIITLRGQADFRLNTVELNGYKWNLEQLIAHEAIHCYQFKKFGFWKSRPFKNYPNWKWEGYPEYVSRQNPDQKDLHYCIMQLLKVDEKNDWAIQFSDKTIAPIDYYKDWVLTKYCLEVLQYSYEDLLKDETKRKVIERDMMHWFNNN